VSCLVVIWVIYKKKKNCFVCDFDLLGCISGFEIINIYELFAICIKYKSENRKYKKDININEVFGLRKKKWKWKKMKKKIVTDLKMW